MIIFALGFLVCAAGIVWLIRSLYLSHTRAFGHAEPTTDPDDCFDDLAIQAPKDFSCSVRVVGTEIDLLELPNKENIRIGTQAFVRSTSTLYQATITNGWKKV